MRRLAMTLAAALVLTTAIHAGNDVQIRPGLTKKELVALWGEPSGTTHMRIPLTIQYVVVWEYIDKTKCVVLFKGRVMEIIDMTKAGPWGNKKNKRRTTKR